MNKRSYKNILYTFSLFILLYSFLALPIYVHAYSQDMENLLNNEQLGEAVALFKAKKYLSASIILKELASDPYSPISTELRGFIFVLATIAAERGGSAQAYKYWGKAMSNFAQSGTDWHSFRKKFERELRLYEFDSTGRAGGMMQTGMPQNLPLSARRLQIIWNLFDLSNYEKPRKGLKEEKNRGWEAGNSEGKKTIIPYTEGFTPAPKKYVPETPIIYRGGPLAAYRMGDTSRPPILPMDRDIGSKSVTSGKVLARSMAPSFKSQEAMEMAARAWVYFLNNFQPVTGMVNSIDGYPVTTVWEIGSSLAAIVSAERLGLINRDEFFRRMRLLLSTLANIDLYNHELPNKLYFTDTARMVGEDQKPSDTGLGWSAIDVARLLLWLKIVGNMYPSLRAETGAVFRHFRTDRLVVNGRLCGIRFIKGKEEMVHEGHFGYGVYAAKALKLWGLDAWINLDYRSNLKFKEVLGINLPYDPRPEAILTSNPFILYALEFGRVDTEEDRLMRAVYEVQVARYKSTGILTAAGDGRIDRFPWFASSAITAKGGKMDWVCLSPFASKKLPLFWASTGVAFGWDALYNTDYTRKLIFELSTLYKPEHGYFAGRYDNGEINKSINLDTNAMILESLLYSFLGHGILEKKKDN